MKLEQIKVRRRLLSEEKYNEVNFDSLVEDLRIISEIAEVLNVDPKIYDVEYVIEQLKDGGEVTTPFHVYSLSEGKECPLCHNYYVSMGALSRRDNETNICPKCGEKEALEDILNAMAVGGRN
jgi:CRISPR/Cas system-associated protein Cas10 (large subunit of type III CRISPR-Cas system)